MFNIVDKNHFEQVHIVDISAVLCNKALDKCEKYKWDNVQVHLCDASEFNFEKADLITFSYSLSMIPEYYKVLDNAKKLLKDDGIIGITDFHVSKKFDNKNRQMNTLTRWFWRFFF
jgi:ubiquinone/menaquinone biosynthesis C-methylase UbiE